jgi:hypothetical protein
VRSLFNIQNFNKQYIIDFTPNKRVLTGLIFLKIGFQNKKVQTTDISTPLLKKSSINEGFGENKKPDNS